ncbi:MAG TPA: SRPBCC family protein [Nocardioidaceae bacterium]|nr:SRPBCC family protein [Nocardioidaceae bacterium]
MALDVQQTRLIALSPDTVAAYAMDWRHDHEWTQGIRTAELTTEAPDGGFGLGAEVTRTAYFLGKRIDYVLRVSGYDPPTELDMRSVSGPMPMHITYRFEPVGAGTRASIRVRGDASTYYRVAGPLMGILVRRNLGKDLRDLERRLTGVTG